MPDTVTAPRPPHVRSNLNRRLTLGAIPNADGTTFRVWAPTAQEVTVSVVTADGVAVAVPLLPGADGFFAGHVTQARAGDRYKYCLGQRGGFPDPASRFQPDGVHGPSEVIDPSAFRWTDAAWKGVEPEDLVVYELHVGTFSPEGTFDGVRERLPYLKELGVTALQLMPVADFPGRWNWGYDGVSQFAPSRVYGRPDDLRRLVDERTGSASGCCWTSSTTTSGRTATTSGRTARTTSPTGTRPRGARPSTSTASTRTRSGRSSSRTRCTGSASTTSTGCGSTPPTPSSTTGRGTSWPS